MAVIARTPRNVAAVTETKPHMRFYRAAVDMDAGTPAYLNATGDIAPTNAGAAGTAATFVGLTLGAVSAGEAVSVLWDGSVEGYDLSGLAYGAPVYLSGTAGQLDTAAGTVSKIAGVVLPLTDHTRTKVLYIQARPF